MGNKPKAGTTKRRVIHHTLRDGLNRSSRFLGYRTRDFIEVAPVDPQQAKQVAAAAGLHVGSFEEENL